MYRLEISHNLLTEIPDDSFSGLERSLWELLLQNNELIEVPSRAIRHLKKLKHLGWYLCDISLRNVIHPLF